MNLEIPFTGIDARTDPEVVPHDRALLICNGFTERDTLRIRSGYRLMRLARIVGTEQVIVTIGATYPVATAEEKQGIIAGREIYSPYRHTEL